MCVRCAWCHSYALSDASTPDAWQEHSIAQTRKNRSLTTSNPGLAVPTLKRQASQPSMGTHRTQCIGVLCLFTCNWGRSHVQTPKRAKRVRRLWSALPRTARVAVAVAVLAVAARVEAVASVAVWPA